MKKHLYSFLFSFLFVSALFAQNPVKVGSGSYAEYTPLYKCRTAEHAGDQSRIMENRTLYISEKNKGLPIPTNDWWTDLIMEKYSGNMWAYPQIVNAEEYGIYVAYPSRWEETHREMKWDSQLEVLGKKFNPVSADANTWHDWGLDFLMKDKEKEMLVTLAHGVPFTWVEAKNIELLLRAKNAKYFNESGEIQFPYTGNKIVVQIGNDAYGVYVPDGTTFDVASDLITVNITGTKRYLSIAVLPTKEDLTAFAEYAYTVPRSTEVVWNYNETTGKVLTQWKLTTENLKGGAQKNVLQGFIPHHYKNSENDLNFTSYEYATPRGKMKMATGQNFNITYKFNGILPHYALPKDDPALANPYNKERMKEMISEYSNKGGFGADTYWGGKGLVQMALYMTFAHEMGETELFEKCKVRLKDALVNWLTFTPGEERFFFGRYNRWGSLIGYETSYDSDTFNDHHFHYGYFTYASGLLALYDEDFKNNYGQMATLLAKDYANWDKNDKEFPFFRTLDPWAGHSYAGGVGGWNGNGQESTSEAMQGWGGVYMLGVATGNKAMRDAGIFGWTLEARGTAEYWFDRDRENIDYTVYDKPYNSNLTSAGIGWWTWFSGDPVWMHSIQWLPISPCLKHLYEDKEYARWEYGEMWKYKEIGGWETQEGLPAALSYESGLGNVVLSYLQIFDPDSTAAVFDRMWDAGMNVAKNPDTGGITYFVTHSNRSYGDICWDINADMPTATTYKHPVTGEYTYMVYNPDKTERTVKFYRDGVLVKEFKAPANKLTAYSDAPYIEKVEIKEPASKVVEPTKTLQLEALLIDQYGATVEGAIDWTVVEGGTITAGGLFTASSNKGTATVKAANGSLNATLELRIDDKPVLTTMKMLPEGQKYLEVGSTLDFSVDARDQYGEPYNAKTTWQILKGAEVVKNDSIFNVEDIGIYTVKATMEGQTVTHEIYLSPKYTNIALNKNAYSSSEENAGTLTKYATDGDVGTRWGSQHEDPQWIYVDLGAESYVGYVNIIWEASYTSLYEMQISDNGQTWTTVTTVNGLGGSETTQINANTRYVRMYGIERGSPYGHSMYEFEIYGVPPMGSTPVLFGIDVQPRLGQIKEGETSKVVAKGYDQFGNEITITPTFSVSAGEGTIDEDGTFTPSKYGKATVEVKVGDKTAKAEYIIEESIKLAEISISPKKVEMIKGTSHDFSCTGKDQFSANYPLDELEYSIIGDGGGILNGSTFIGNAIGTYKIAVGNGVVGDTAVVVVKELSETNLALLKNATASSYENAGTLPSFVNDGDLTTRWGSEFNQPEYVQVDLADNFVIHTAKLFWDGAYASAYRIEVSLDEMEWKTVFTDANNSGGDKTIEFSPAAARYVRVVCTERATVWGSSIKELEIYGSHFWVNPQPTRMEITPDPLVAYIGEDLPITVDLFDQYDLPYDTESGFIWNITGGGSIDSDGVFTPDAVGEYTLSVHYGGLKSQSTVRVLAAKEDTKLEVTPIYSLVKTNEEIQLTANVIDQYGNKAVVTPVWSVSGANVTSEGIFSATAAGKYEVTATYGSLTAISQIEVIVAPTENLALKKPITSSSGVAEAANDGDAGSRWESEHRDGPEWLLIDLKDAYIITDLELIWEGASARDYEVQISKDGNEWSTLQDVTGLSGARTDKWRVNGMGRYLRVWCTKRSTQWGYSIHEFRAYGLQLQAQQPYIIEFSNSQSLMQVGEEVQYGVKVLDKNGDEISNPILSWSTAGLGNISDNGLFVPTLAGQSEIIISSGFATSSYPIQISFPTSLAYDQSESPVIIYPNPAKDKLQFSETVSKVSVYSMQGQLVLKSVDTNEIEVSHLARGIYIVQLTDKSGNRNTVKVKLIN